MAAHTDQETVINHSERLVKLEETVNQHGLALKELVPSVAEIKGHLAAIKWCGFGALSLYLAQQFGLNTVLKALLHLPATH